MKKHSDKPLLVFSVFIAIAIGVSSAPGITGHAASNTEDVSRWSRLLRAEADKPVPSGCSVTVIDNVIRNAGWTCDDACGEKSCSFSMTTWSRPIEYDDGTWTEDTTWTQLNDCQTARGDSFATMADGSSRKKRIFCVCC
ncbi:hypothetical protein HY492_01620 [Candidatus Woesearchaeota archaeon]|nr:hypothetical protein [Candidatus Woesearchaeota archaeon]